MPNTEARRLAGSCRVPAVVPQVQFGGARPGDGDPHDYVSGSHGQLILLFDARLGLTAVAMVLGSGFGRPAARRRFSRY
ncbi:hypothetical protein [Streptomyces sp. TLI_053]|uniref:hypothetical protein n=1 Tax=Streptomyces sp. TLI_053 TaxID=1855352 RepID=UPI0013520815|nr:hypothetical protein [Streptomyces sp. TLI_053]